MLRLFLLAQIAALIWAFLLPSVDNSLYFNRREDKEDQERGTTKEVAITNEAAEKLQPTSTTVKRQSNRKYKNAFLLLWAHFRSSYTNPDVIIWSIWYSIGMCGYLQVISYAQVLWNHIDSTPTVSDYDWNIIK